MHNSIISRRSFTLGLGGSVLGSTLGLAFGLTSPSTLASTKTKTHTRYVSAATDRAHNHYLVILDADGKQLSKLDLPARAHQIAFNSKSNTLAIAARRPGEYLMIVNSINGELIQEIHPEIGHHFYGHSTYSADNRFLFTSENHIESGEGRIFVRDATANYKVLRSFPSYGIGPHEIKIHTDEKTLVVANGGILTHPESGRTKLNLDTMSPSLVYISLETGELLEERKLPENLHQLSIRHIDINSNGITAIAMQYQGDKTDNVPLIALHQRGKAIKTLWAPEYVNRKMKNYCGSVCFNQSGSIFAVSSPRGNIITLWDTEQAEFISNLACSDVCGISQSETKGFIFSNGFGQLFSFDLRKPVLTELSKANLLAWDNHLMRI
jgi:hypothetical protein